MTSLLAVSLVGSLCLTCQWIAWRFRLPAIVLLSLAGILLGPVSGILQPQALFGESMHTLISIAVAIILFDGGLGLRFKELKEMRRTVLQMVLIGAPLGWLLTSLACHYVGQISWPVSLVFGGILVVTGPTVILPLLRQARLQVRAAAVLKWEGIVNDPLGALFAVIAFEYFASPDLQHSPVMGFTYLGLRIAIISAGSFLLGKLIEWAFHRGYMPEFLKQPVVLIMVLLTYALANILQDEGGLVAVTILGITLANSDLPNLEEMRRFKEYLSLLLVSLVFILITATLHWHDLMLLNWQALLFIFTLLLVVRPLTVLFSTFRSGVTRQELLFIGWIAPRGVVCAAVSGLFGPQLVEMGYADGAKMVPLAFGIVFATVLGHGFTIQPWGKKLGLISDQAKGLLLVGANPFTVALAEKLKELNFPVLIADRNWHHLRLARQMEIPVHYGEVLSDEAEYKMELNRFGAIISATDNPAYNMLVATHFAHEFGHERIFRLAVEAQSDNQNKISSVTLRVPAILNELLYEDVMDRMRQGWKIKIVHMSEEHPYSLYKEKMGDSMICLLSLMPTGIVIHAGAHLNPQESGYSLAVFASEQINAD
jgi:NhaP-type Na+/H+ or K+/H+ antiporter